MDKSLSKGLMRQFLRKLSEKNLSFLKEIIAHKQNLKKQNYKSWKNLISNLNSSQNNLMLHNIEFGSKRKPKFGFTLLMEGNFNPDAKFDELILGGETNIFQLNPSYLHDQRIRFTVSHHVFSRMFERNKNLKWDEFENAQRIIKEELEFIPLFTILWRALSFVIKDNDSKISSELSNLSFLVPAKSGLLLGRMSEEAMTLMIRTYVDDSMLSVE